MEHPSLCCVWTCSPVDFTVLKGPLKFTDITDTRMKLTWFMWCHVPKYWLPRQHKRKTNPTAEHDAYKLTTIQITMQATLWTEIETKSTWSPWQLNMAIIFPGCSHLQYLIAYSMQMQRGKTLGAWSHAATSSRQWVDSRGVVSNEESESTLFCYQFKCWRPER